MNERARRRLILGVTLAVAAAGFAVLGASNMGDNLVYYWSPTEVREAGDRAHGATIRLGGMVKEGSLSVDAATGAVRFTVTDETDELVVQTTSAPPAMLREGIGAVVEGTLGDDGVFEGRRVLVKHSNEYRAPKEGKHPGDIYQTVEGL